MVTLSDVARRAGVSAATASRVINDTPYHVAPALRARVLAAVEELRFVPNAHAQALARSRSGTVGVLLHDVSDPYFAEITRGLQRVATASDRLVTICNSYRVPDRDLAYLELLRAQRVDALVYAGSGYDDPGFNEVLSSRLAAFLDDDTRVVVIGRHDLRGRAGINAIVPDNVGGATAIAGAVLDAGHVDVGVIAGPRLLTTTLDRLRGLRAAFEGRGLRLSDERVVYGDFSRDGGLDGVAALLTRGPGLTAVIALSDIMAVGALGALRRAGRRVPDDVSVSGFDDMPIAADVTPALTTVRVPLVEMGVRAMTLALGGGAGDGRTGRRETVATTLVARDSVVPPRSAGADRGG